MVHRRQGPHPTLRPEKPNPDRIFHLYVLSDVCYAWRNVSDLPHPYQRVADRQIPITTLLSKWKKPFTRTIRYRYHPLHVGRMCRYLCFGRCGFQDRSLLPMARRRVSLSAESCRATTDQLVPHSPPSVSVYSTPSPTTPPTPESSVSRSLPVLESDYVSKMVYSLFKPNMPTDPTSYPKLLVSLPFPNSQEPLSVSESSIPFNPSTSTRNFELERLMFPLNWFDNLPRRSTNYPRNNNSRSLTPTLLPSPKV